MGFKVSRFGSKTDNQRGAFACRKVGDRSENIGVGDEVERGRGARPILFELGIGRLGDTPIGNGGGKDRGVGGKGCGNGRFHFERCFNRDDFAAPGL